jgi:hypothetical protein
VTEASSSESHDGPEGGAEKKSASRRSSPGGID